MLFFSQCLSHLRSLRCLVSRKISSPWTNERAVAWTIRRRLLRSCLPKVALDHELIWLIISYRLNRLACAAGPCRLRFRCDRRRHFMPPPIHRRSRWMLARLLRDVRVGTIAVRTGYPDDTDPWVQRLFTLLVPKTAHRESERGINSPSGFTSPPTRLSARTRDARQARIYAEPSRFTDAGAEALHADRVGCCSIFLRISSQTDLTSAVIADACSMRSKISFASSRYFCAVSWT